jgi:hypothetical protein
MVPIEEREQFFMSQIALGEQMAAQGASSRNAVEAARTHLN